MNIAVFDYLDGKFTKQFVDYWRFKGHTVTQNHYWGPELCTGMDVLYFDMIDNNLVQASNGMTKSPGQKVIVRGIDIDVYSGYAGGVNWSFVDDLIFIALHIQQMFNNSYPGVCENQHLIPPGVDLDKWTYKDREHGYNIGWVGNKWITKNIGRAFELIYELKRIDNNYKLHIVSNDNYSPDWWGSYCNYLIDLYEIQDNIVWNDGYVEDLNEWWEDKNYALLTSMKEAFSYVTAEACAKGIKPLVLPFAGVEDIWPVDFRFKSLTDAVSAVLDRAESPYIPSRYRSYIEERYSEERFVNDMDNLLPYNNVA